MADLAYSSTIQNQIAQLLFGQVYSSISSDQKAAIDATWSSGSLTGGYAKNAFDILGQFGAEWYQAGAGISPDVWQHWLVHKTCRIAAVNLRPDRVEQFIRLDQESQAVAVAMFNLTDPAASGLDSVSTTLTAKAVRFHAMQAAMLRTPPVFLTVREIDAATIRVLRDLWNRADWNFKRRRVTMSIDTSSNVTFATGLAAGETFHSFSSTYLTYSDTNVNLGVKLLHTDADTIEQMVPNVTATGRPQYFRVQRSGTTFTYRFVPAPDTTYTVAGEVFIAGPGNPSSSTDTTPFDLFPTEFGPLIKDAVLARCLINRGIPDGRVLLAESDQAINVMAPKYQELGNVDKNAGLPRDVYRDSEAIGMYQNFGGGL